MKGCCGTNMRVVESLHRKTTTANYIQYFFYNQTYNEEKLSKFLVVTSEFTGFVLALLTTGSVFVTIQCVIVKKVLCDKRI